MDLDFKLLQGLKGFKSLKGGEKGGLREEALQALNKSLKEGMRGLEVLEDGL